MIAGFNPRRRAMLMPAEAPGTPTFSSYVGCKGGFVESDRCVQDSGRVCGVDLERCVVGGDDRHAPDAAKVAGDGDGESGSFFGIGGGAQFVEQDQRVARSRCGR